MKNKIAVASIFFLLVMMADAQTKTSYPILVKKFKGEVIFDAMQEWALRVNNFREKSDRPSDVRVVIRLCTRESLKKALTKSALSFPAIIEIFEGYQFDRSKIIILKSGKCSDSVRRSTVPTELWVTDDENALPSYAIKYLANDARIAKKND